MGRKQKTKYRKFSFPEGELESIPTQTGSSGEVQSKEGNTTIPTNDEMIGCTSGTSVVVSDDSRPSGTAAHITLDQSRNNNPVQNCWQSKNMAAMVQQCALPAKQNISSNVPFAYSTGETEISELPTKCPSKSLTTDCSQSQGHGTEEGPYLNVDANEFVPRDASNHSDDSLKSVSVSPCRTEEVPHSPLECYKSIIENRKVSSVASSEKDIEPRDDWNNRDHRNYSNRENTSLDHNTGDSNKDNRNTSRKKQYFNDNRRDDHENREHNYKQRQDSSQSRNRTDKTRESKRSGTNQYHSHSSRRDSDREVTSKSKEFSGDTSALGSQHGRPSFGNKKLSDPRNERERKSLDAESKIHNRSATDDDSGSVERRNSYYFDGRYEKTDEEYRQFNEEYKKNERAKFIKVKEIEKDLFEMPSDYALGHCVAEDMRMGSGIAVQFKRDFKQVGELLEQRQKQGGLAYLKIDKRFIYYLVTKRASNGKPTYETFWNSLKKLRDHINENHVKHLAIPRIGCGLDRLEWSKVKFMLEFLFRDVNVEITVCNFQQTEDSIPQKDYLSNKIVDETKSLVEMEEYTMIIYYASEDGHISEVMERLDKKFNFLSEFKKWPKKFGEPIKCERKNYILHGCVVRRTKEALFNFVAFGNCLSQINKNNRKANYPFEYVAVEEEYDSKDEFLNERIITLLRFHLRDVNIHICPASNVNH